MKKLTSGLFLALLVSTSFTWGQNAVPADIQTAQQKVWDIQVQLNNARYRLAVLKLDLQKAKQSDALLKAQQKGDQAQIAKIQQQLQATDHQKDIEQKRLDLLGQILQAQQQNNNTLVQTLQFELKNMR